MLDERKRRVLQAVIDDYIASAEPVGSRTLARKYDLGVSPATIRNEMADLEMLGYLEHIHTSSGRIPSSKGYRFYVNGLIPPKPVSDEEKALIDRWYKSRVKRIEEVFQETARLISRMTRNVSFVLAPQISRAAFRCLQFLPLDDHRVITVLMTDAGFVENKILEMPDGASFEDFQRMAKVINKVLAGQTLKSIEQKALQRIEDEINDNVSDDITMKNLNFIIDNLQSRGFKVMIYTNGNGYKKYVKDRPFVNVNLWLCSFKKPDDIAHIPHQLQQYSHHGRVDGINGDVDLDVFNGNEKQWEQWLSNAAPLPADTTTTDKKEDINYEISK